MIHRQRAPGGLYAFALADGTTGVEYADRIDTSQGRVELPGEGVLGLVGTRYKGDLRMAGQGHETGLAWYYHDGQWTSHGPTHGVRVCAFGQDVLCIAIAGDAYREIDLETSLETVYPKQIGSQGIRYVENNLPVTGDETIGFHPAEFTKRGDVTVGQGHDGGCVINGRRLESGDCYFVNFDRDGDALAIAFSKFHEQCAVIYRLTTADIAGLAAYDDGAPVDPVVAVNRPLWFGFFTFGATFGLPGNCSLAVRDLFLRADSDNTLLAQYVAAEQDGTFDGLQRAIETARSMHKGLPVMAYWPRGLQGGPLPSADYIGVEAYCGADETSIDFEYRIGSVLARCPSVALIAQGYTSNSSLTSNLTALVPVYARLARHFQQVKAVLVFSAGSRATGWSDHPEIHAPWAQFAAGVGNPATPAPVPSFFPRAEVYS